MSLFLYPPINTNFDPALFASLITGLAVLAQHGWNPVL